ncbi:MAG: Dam family site-specific DNA-(adenine-N6)-methyltransferase [Bacteroidales bacterium]|jgi:DNA adenine methylase Dam|nr:Dam family site-specific DNA-(adenine-N6)-methyltransferase [Bacteroidales bacterium]
MRINNKIIPSPFNYSGGKYKLLPQLLPLFPNDVKLFADLFSGGGNVGINVNAEKVLLNDTDNNLVNLYLLFNKLDEETIFNKIFETIEKYKLSRSDLHDYSFYNCDSANGLMPYNKEKYLLLRKDFNSLKRKDEEYYLLLYVIIVFSFNNQIRFNSKGEFNLPIGKRDFNKCMQKKLFDFIYRIKEDRFVFDNKSFDNVDNTDWDENTFVYCDPPYLITCATYNEQNKWNEQFEKKLLNFLDMLTERNIKFALSNVIKSKGKENRFLQEWLTKNKNRYSVVNLDFNYANSNYRTKDRSKSTNEVLILNYRK